MKYKKYFINAIRAAFVLSICSVLLSGCGQSESVHDGKAHEHEHSAGGPPCVIVSTTDLMGIVEAIAGDLVELHCFGKGNQDPHALDILPSYVREMNDADLWIQVGNDIEAAWYPDLMVNVKNPKIKQGAAGFIDTSELVMPLEGTVGNVSGIGHSSGLHPSGNPHYLLDPIEGIRAAKLVTDRLSSILPEQKDKFQQNFEKFRKRLADALIGNELADRHGIIEIADLYLKDELTDFLSEQGHGIPLSGWLGQLSKYRGTPIVGDHDLWPYFSRRVGFSVVGYFEPEPGVTPTTKHLRILIDQMKAESVSIIFSAPYFDERHARFVSENTKAQVLPMCHQTKARTNTDTYFDMIQHNMETVIAALNKDQN
ncbi:MAG: metal ABC transporter substrate-binding protein [Verrucomicrobiota bacterium]|nr:metal ABC transporter substrate-binding protein [Verrucomicrobiota bacterium]